MKKSHVKICLHILLSGGYVRDLKDLGVLLLGFFPWILFLFLSGNTFSSLERATVVSLVASVVFGFRELKRGYILQWGTLLFFSTCVVAVNLFKVVWVATNMDLLANGALAITMWLSIFVGRPFALQYARKDLPKERWQDPKVIQGCYLITIVWASLMSLAFTVSVIRRTSLLDWPDCVYFGISLCIIISGLTFTTIYKRQKRLQRERAGAAN
jgi:carotenoid cleavage dioxygenase